MKIICTLLLSLSLIVSCAEYQGEIVPSATQKTSAAMPFDKEGKVGTTHAVVSDSYDNGTIFKDPALHGFYVHPKPSAFSDLKISTPLPNWFVQAYPRRAEMGNQYLEVLGIISIVGETETQQLDIKKIAHALMGLIDSNEDGQADDQLLWKKLTKHYGNKGERLVLYVTEERATYKAFDGASPQVYDGAWSSYRGEEILHNRVILEELLHFLQMLVWKRAYPNSFGLTEEQDAGLIEDTLFSTAHEAALKAVKNRHYVYDEGCVCYAGCLVPEFFFCVMTDVIPGWSGDGFDAPSNEEWRLKGDLDTLYSVYPDLTNMIRSMQKQGQLPLKWPRPKHDL